MAAAVKPTEFWDAVPDGTESWGTLLRMVFIQLPVLIWRMFKWKYQSDRSFSQAYVSMVCEVCETTAAAVPVLEPTVPAYGMADESGFILADESGIPLLTETETPIDPR